MDDCDKIFGRVGLGSRNNSLLFGVIRIRNVFTFYCTELFTAVDQSNVLSGNGAAQSQLACYVHAKPLSGVR